MLLGKNPTPEAYISHWLRLQPCVAFQNSPSTFVSLQMNDLGTIATTFSPAATCLATSNVWKVSGQLCGDLPCWYYLQGPTSTSACLPTGYNPDPDSYFAATECPQGYSTACSQRKTTGTGTEILATCCPT